MRRRLLLGASFSALATAAQAQVRLFGPQPPGAAIGRHGRPTYGPSPLGVPPPTLDLNFLTGALAPAITFSRSDTVPVASYTDATGVLRYGPVNLLANSAALPGAGATAVTLTAAATTAPDGTLTAVKMTESATGPTEHYSDVSTLAPAISTTYTFSVYAKAGTKSTAAIELRVGTTWPNGGGVCFVNLATGTITSVSQPGYVTSITAVGNGWYRLSISATTTAAGTGSSWRLALTDSTPAVGYTGNGTDYIYMWGGQVELGPNMTGFISTGASATGGPRFDYSPATVTNWIRNSTMLGGAAGVYPSLWSETHNTAITPTIVGVGTESGIPYVDIRFNGAATAGNNNIFYDSAAVIQALSGQTWTHSVYLRIVGGSTANLSSVNLIIQQRDASNTAVGGLTTNVVASLNGNALATNRFAWSPTLVAATTANVLALLQVNPTAAAIDITLRIGAPQFEQSAAASTFIPTSGTFAGSGGVVRGLLIEEARTNLLFPSGDVSLLFTNNNTTMTAAQGTAPDGGNTMVRFAEDATTNIHWAQKTGIAITASATYTVSIFAKAQQKQYLQLLYQDGANNGAYATFDLIAGTISGAATNRGTGTGAAATIQSIGNGIYRCSVSGVCGASAVAGINIFHSLTASPGFAPSYAGNAANGLLVWGAQLEASPNGLPTTYIPAVGVAVTRGSDNATVALSPPAAFSLATEFIFPALSTTGALQGFVVVDDGTINNRLSGRVGSAVPQAAAVVGGGATASATGTTITVNATVKTAFVSNGSAATITLAANGVATAAASGVQPTGLTTLRVGINNLGSNWGNGWTRRVRYWPTPLTNQQLVQVTT